MQTDIATKRPTWPRGPSRRKSNLTFTDQSKANGHKQGEKPKYVNNASEYPLAKKKI